MSEMMSRLLVLQEVVKQGAEHLPWCGNLAMQKLVYLLENVFCGDLGYEYGYHHLGPYSSELAGDLSLGVQAKLWECETQTRNLGSNSFTGNQYRPLEPSFVLPETKELARQRWEVVAPRMKALISFVGDMSGRQLELLATLHYLQHVQAVSDAELREVLQTLKPKYSNDEFAWGKQKLTEMTSSQVVAT